MARFLHETRGEPTYTFEFTRNEAMLIADFLFELGNGGRLLERDTQKSFVPTDGDAVENLSRSLDYANVYQAQDDWYDRWAEPF